MTEHDENTAPETPDEAKDSSPAAPVEVTPDLQGVPEDDNAEPEDAGVDHTASEAEVEGQDNA